jgi:hypothetical protein
MEGLGKHILPAVGERDHILITQCMIHFNVEI